MNVGINGREPQGAGSGGGPVITFQPESGLDAVVEDLKGKGVEFPADISEHDWSRIVTFKDPEGNDLQLYEPPNSQAATTRADRRTQVATCLVCASMRDEAYLPEGTWRYPFDNSAFFSYPC